MQQTSEKKKKREGAAKNPQVSVRLNVRPLRANWKPAKIYEPPPAPPRQNRVATPVEDQLDTSVWKSKHIRTDVIKAVVVEKDPGLVGKCDCKNCGRADDAQTVCEQGEEAARNVVLEEKKHKRRHHKSQSNKKRRHHGAPRARSMTSPPPPHPPNSFMSAENQKLWCKLYEQTCPPPVKAIDLKKLRNLPGQIGMSELEPEGVEVTPESFPDLQIMKPPPVSPPSNISEQIHHQPPLVPQPESRPDPNLIILPAPTNDLPPAKSPMHHVIKQDKDIPSPGASSGSTQAPEHSAIPSISMIRKMERIFYSSESSCWLIVVLVMLTIFAYRSSMEQYTCYYD